MDIIWKKYQFRSLLTNPKYSILLIIFVLLLTKSVLYLNDIDNVIFAEDMLDDYNVAIAQCESLRRHRFKAYPAFIDIETDTNKKDTIDCFRFESNTLPDISEINPRPNRSIFFHETSCRSYNEGKITITSRQACAVESAARLNPNFDIYLLYSSPGEFKFGCDESSLFLKGLLSYDNVNIMHINYGNYINNTPVESLYKTLEASDHTVAHASDILRYLTLWKYGGIYLDLDVIILKSLEDLKLNFAAVQSEYEVAAGALSFDASGKGHKWVETCLNDLKTHFTGKEWADSSVGVISRLLENICGVETVPEMLESDCQGFNVLPENTFYAIPYQNWISYFSNDTFQYVIDKCENSYAIHAWNKLSFNRKINKYAPRIPYTYFAEKFCPKVFKACEDFC